MFVLIPIAIIAGGAVAGMWFWKRIQTARGLEPED